MRMARNIFKFFTKMLLGTFALSSSFGTLANQNDIFEIIEFERILEEEVGPRRQKRPESRKVVLCFWPRKILCSLTYSQAF